MSDRLTFTFETSASSPIDNATSTKRKDEKLGVLSCEVCETVKTPDAEQVSMDVEDRRVHECARSESNVIIDRSQAVVRQPAAQTTTMGENCRTEMQG